MPFHTVLVYLRSKRKEGEREKRGETHRLVDFLIPQHSINASFLYGDLYTYPSIAQRSVNFQGSLHRGCLGDGVRGADDSAQCFQGCLTFLGTEYR